MGFDKLCGCCAKLEHCETFLAAFSFSMACKSRSDFDDRMRSVLGVQRRLLRLRGRLDLWRQLVRYAP